MTAVSNANSPTITVSTPAFNRTALLPRVYKSLLAQSQGDFEWIIVDDGSTDGTPEAAREWVGCNPLPVRYAYEVRTTEGKSAAPIDVVLYLRDGVKLRAKEGESR